jgi:hypothetical protein
MRRPRKTEKDTKRTPIGAREEEECHEQGTEVREGRDEV